MCNGEGGREKREKGTEAVFEAIITKNFPQLNTRYQTHRSKKLREHQAG